MAELVVLSGRNALAAHADAEDKKDALIQGPFGGAQKMSIINEPISLKKLNSLTRLLYNTYFFVYLQQITITK